MATIGSMIVNVLANTAGFVNGMKTVRGELSAVKAQAAITQSALGALGGVRNVLAGVGVGITGGAIVRYLTDTADEIDRLVKVSDRLGITTENLRGLEYGAGLAGVSTEELSSALGFMSKQLAEAAHGGGKAKDVIKELGLSARQLAQMTPDEALLTFTRALAGVKDETEKVRIAMRVFGNAGQPLLTLLNEGEEAVRGYVQEAKSLGLTYSKEEADKVVAFNDAFEKLKNTLGGFTKDIVIDVSPAALALVKDLQELVAGKDKDKPRLVGDYLPGGPDGYAAAAAKVFARNEVRAYYKDKKASGKAFYESPIKDDPLSDVERGAFTKEELEAARARIAPHHKGDLSKTGDRAYAALMEEKQKHPFSFMTDEQRRKILASGTRIGIGGIASGVDAIVSGYQKAAKGLAMIDEAGAKLGKGMLIDSLISPTRPFVPPSEIAKAKEAAAKAKEDAELKAEREAESRFRLQQPTPTAPRGSAASREQIRQSQQQAAQLKEARNANLHLRGIKDALTNPRATGL